MKYLFILGRNIELSKAEIFSYLETSGNKILSSDLNKNGFFVNVEDEILPEIVNVLGGTVSMGKIITMGNGDEIFSRLDKENLYSGNESKLNYVVWNFSNNYDSILDYLKNRFKSEKVKATLKHLNNDVNLQEGGIVRLPSSKLLNEEYFVYDFNGETYFGKIVSTCDYEALEKRDMGKPVRRESLAISPRLAKILINLSGVYEGETLLDPFCGIGTVLTEALIRGIKVIGIDKDKKAISGARQNLEWSGFKRDNYELISSDSTKAQILKANVIATEPDLGETLKKIPTRSLAEETLKNFEELIINILNNFKDKISGRIVFTSPYIRIGKKRLKCNIDKILEATGYKMTYEIPEFRLNQIVGRMIYVLGK